jgi:hypothetical protein
MSRKIFGAAAAALTGAVCLAALYGPALRAPAAPPAQVAAAAPAGEPAPAALRGRIGPVEAAAPAPVVLAEVATTPASGPASIPAPVPQPAAMTAQSRPAAPVAPLAAPTPSAAPAPAGKVVAAHVPNSAPQVSGGGPEGVPRRSFAAVSAVETSATPPAPLRIETVVVQAQRVQTAPPPSLDRIGRGNSVTISLPRKAPA